MAGTDFMPGAAAGQLDVLRLLVVGETQQAIARALHLAQRTVVHHVAALMREMCATNRLQGGAYAISSGRVGASYVTSRIAQRRGHDRWVPPTPRQGRVLELLGSGISLPAAADLVGLSVRTVRREVSVMAVTNGARNLWSLGALATALGWLRPEPPGQNVQSRLTTLTVDRR